MQVYFYVLPQTKVVNIDPTVYSNLVRSLGEKLWNRKIEYGWRDKKLKSSYGKMGNCRNYRCSSFLGLTLYDLTIINNIYIHRKSLYDRVRRFFLFWVTGFQFLGVSFGASHEYIFNNKKKNIFLSFCHRGLPIFKRK